MKVDFLFFVVHLPFFEKEFAFFKKWEKNYEGPKIDMRKPVKNDALGNFESIDTKNT
jgi:hypothetical protein